MSSISSPLKYDVDATRNVVVKGRDYDVPHNVMRTSSGWQVRIENDKALIAQYFGDSAYGGTARSLECAASFRNIHFYGKTSRLTNVEPSLLLFKETYLYAVITLPTKRKKIYLGKDGYVTQAKIDAAFATLRQMRIDSLHPHLHATDRLPSDALIFE